MGITVGLMFIIIAVVAWWLFKQTADSEPWIARTTIVEGAVGMVEMALDQLAKGQIVELDEERQARLLELIQSTLPGQAVITAPRDSEVPSVLCERPRWTMQGGMIETG